MLTLDTKHSFCYIKRTDHWNETAAEMWLMLSMKRLLYRVTEKKWELLKNPTKIEEIQEKKIIDRN